MKKDSAAIYTPWVRGSSKPIDSHELALFLLISRREARWTATSRARTSGAIKIKNVSAVNWGVR
jgi:hypothetical protein